MIRILRHGCKVSALLAALVLPSLAYAEHKEWDWDRDRDWGRDRDHRKAPPVVAVPEANTGWVLAPVMGAILLVSSVRLLRTRKVQIHR